MTPNERLKRARETIGKSEREIAAAAGLTAPAYFDLEGYEDEIFMCASLREIRDVCCALDIRAIDLFDPDTALHDRKLSFTEIRSALVRYLAEQCTPLPEFEQKVGWGLDDFLNDPEVAWEWNVDCLRDVSGGLKLNWRAALP